VETSPWSAPRIAGLVGLGLGAVGVGVSIGVAVSAKGAYDTALNGPDCDAATKVCNPTGEKAVNDARATGDAATGIFVAGAVLGGVGLILAIAAPNDKRTVPAQARLELQPRAGGGTLMLKGSVW